ncbi:hypothetical protein E4T38_06561 [Aureobasidium subglaciale]|nr:hypothetical protein E4T38_06561 [Aureobasidium subglaciale]KAI5218969.1 hypothetical protein E4T40_06680 [Aureobasidium subglaciale]KAI5222697.1 hypothetical protein E4T41_06501 [Aureobasidium subglaciale]KAI5260187.1 hypothetical protein E4T46_06213 [Aureobasidium subglaciale]
MASDQDIYKLLGLSRNADQAQIKKAFHAACLKNHPDKNKRESANSTMQAINAAYEVLGDPKKKDDYDRKHPEMQPSGAPRRILHPGLGLHNLPLDHHRAIAGQKSLYRVSSAGRHTRESALLPLVAGSTVPMSLLALRHLICTCHARAATGVPTRPRRIAVTERSAYRPYDIDVSFNEVKHMLRPDIRADCERLRLLACQWCGSSESLLNVCRDHIWCQRCLLQLHVSATRDPACCRRMREFSSIKHFLPGPAIALYEMKVTCNFKFWHHPSVYNKLLQEWMNWQNQYPDMA